MRMINFGLIAVLSCIAVIGATPAGNSAPAEAITRRQGYVPYAAAAHGGSDLIEKSSSSFSCSQLLTFYTVCQVLLPAQSCAVGCDLYNGLDCQPPLSC